MYRRSSSSNRSPSHALLDTLYTLQILESLLMQHINIELFHDLNHNIQRFEKAVDSDAQHAICCGFILGSQDSLLLDIFHILAGSGDERESPADERREFLVNG